MKKLCKKSNTRDTIEAFMPSCGYCYCFCDTTDTKNTERSMELHDLINMISMPQLIYWFCAHNTEDGKEGESGKDQ